MNLAYQNHLRTLTRRHFFEDCRVGLGSVALASLLGPKASAALNPMEPKASPETGKAKNVIYLFMAGGPSQLELFDHKPLLAKYSGQKPPEEAMKGKRFAFIASSGGFWPENLASRGL